MEPLQSNAFAPRDRSLALFLTRTIVEGLTILLIFGIFTFAKACDPDGAQVACRAASRAILISGIVACGISLALDLPSNPLIRCLFDMLIALCGLFIALAPGRLFPLCADAASRCNTAMHPFATAVGAALFVMANVDCVVTFRHAMRLVAQVAQLHQQMTEAQSRAQAQPGAQRQVGTNRSRPSSTDKSKYKG